MRPGGRGAARPAGRARVPASTPGRRTARRSTPAARPPPAPGDGGRPGSRRSLRQCQDGGARPVPAHLERRAARVGPGTGGQPDCAVDLADQPGRRVPALLGPRGEQPYLAGARSQEGDRRLVARRRTACRRMRARRRGSRPEVQQDEARRRAGVSCATELGARQPRRRRARPSSGRRGGGAVVHGLAACRTGARAHRPERVGRGGRRPARGRARRRPATGPTGVGRGRRARPTRPAT